MGEVMVCSSIWISACHLETGQIGLEVHTKCVTKKNRLHRSSFSCKISTAALSVGWALVSFESDAVEVELKNM